MAIIKNNLMNLALKQKIIGSKIYYIDNDGDGELDASSVINDFDYDSMTHTFTLMFDNGEIVEFSDKIKYDLEIPDNSVNLLIPNRKRKKHRR